MLFRSNIGLVRNHANAAYDLANTNASSITVLQSVNTTQNTNISNTDTKAQVAFTHANSSYDKANAVGVFSQSAYNQANTNSGDITVIQSVNSTQNTNISSVDAKAQAAYDAANSAGSNLVVVASFDTANAAFEQAKDRKSTRLNSSHSQQSRMPSSA